VNVRLLIATVVGAATLVSGTTAVAAASSRDHADLLALRAATNRFHSIAAAEQHGYALLTDAKGIACIDLPPTPQVRGGGMGVHWANSTLVGDPAIVAGEPEALVYAPGADGTLTLAAVEYVVLKSAWDAKHSQPPRLFGHKFDFTQAPNRYGLPPFYALHVWVWEHNPAGTFAPWNPKVTCPKG